MDGLLLVDKPIGPTSHDIVARVRRILGERAIGHTGTLDPMASGLLVLVLGRATRLARFLSASDKTYDAEIRLGFATSTYDAQGEAVAPAYDGPLPTPQEIDRALDAFRGTFLQQPPAYSAKKIGGQRSYKIARAARGAGPQSCLPPPAARSDSPALPAQPALSAEPALSTQPALPAPVSVTARSVELIGVDGDGVTLRVDCSAGFYVRSLAHDLGQRLGVGAHLAALRRIRSGEFSIASAVALDTLERDPEALRRAIVPLAGMLTGLASAVLNEAGERHVAHGRNLGPGDIVALTPATAAGPPTTQVRLLDRTGRLLGVAEPMKGSGLLHPSVVLV